MSISIIFIHSAEMWSELNRLVSGKNIHSHITCDISANYFNHHFANISNKMNSKFQNFDDNYFWKGFYWENQPHIFLYHWQIGHK